VVTERTVTDLETTALHALRSGQFGDVRDGEAAVRELARRASYTDVEKQEWRERIAELEAGAVAAEADRDRLQAENELLRVDVDEWTKQVLARDKEAQTLRDALEQLRWEAENELRRQGCLCLYSRCPIHGESEGKLAAAVRAALATPDTPPDA
jgi:chromosome segregation ATPase